MDLKYRKLTPLERKRFQDTLRSTGKVCASLFVLFLVVGFGIGRYNSQTYTDPTKGRTAMMRFVANYGSIIGERPITHQEAWQGKVPDGFKLSFTCEDTAYDYDPKAKTLDVRASTAEETGRDYWGHSLRKQITSLDGALGTLGGAAAVGVSTKDAYVSFSQT